MSNKTVFSLELFRNDVRITAFFAFAIEEHYQNIFEKVQGFLHPNELIYFNNLKSEKRKFSYLTGRYCGKLAISQFLSETEMKDIEIRPGIFDQPIVRHHSIDTPEITISHCSDLAVAIAFPPGHIMGIDVEEIDFSKTHVFKSQLTQSEIDKVDRSFDDSRIGFHLIWTAKEALSKALKCGLTVPFDILEVEQIGHFAESGYLSSYKNFAQYKCISWVWDKHLLSIALPRKTDMKMSPLEKMISILGNGENHPKI